MIGIPEIFFYIFCALIFGSSLLVVFSYNLLRSAFALFFVLFGIAGFYVLLGGDFLAVIQIMVYAGGINILLIFGTMMTGSISQPETSNPSFQGILTLIGGGGLLLILLIILNHTTWPSQSLIDHGPTTKQIGQLLLRNYILPFEVISFLLVAAMVGAIVLINKGERS
ncbi:MAG: NADH-quinone oxidoreductase subunit J [Deltaproteobacteria bacterium]|nr:NADH-quinone oxidoreductase subunit J [Deltaproteobacteria bacterium]